MSKATVELITDPAALAAAIEDLRHAQAYAVDTEFHRERTYFAQLALLQIAWDGKVALIDPLAVDIASLAEVFDGEGICVMHACRQDLEIMERHCGRLPRNIADTQLMAMFAGYTTPSLASLMERELGIRMPKADRLTDWLRRPLSDAQLRYAASDVDHLVELYEILDARLVERGRRDWFDLAMAELLEEPRGARDVAEAWRRIKEARHLRGVDLAVAQRIAAWREQRAIDLDLTPRFVLGDLAVVGIAAARPTSRDELRSIRGVDGRAVRDQAADQLLELIRDAATAPIPKRHREPQSELPAQLRPVLPLVSAWISQLARDLEVDSAMLGTRSDIEALLRGDDDARLRHGWRGDVVAAPIEALVEGSAAIAFEPGRGLVLVPTPEGEG
jgi:ribonuclease D